MIGKLTGLIDSIEEDHLILDVGGVGYLVQCPGESLRRVPEVGETVTLLIETYVREDQIRLFGFLTDAERAWFRLLTTVQGVGVKVALGVLGALPPNELANAIAARDKTTITRAPGVGPKVAGRIVSELKDKAPALAVLPGQEHDGHSQDMPANKIPQAAQDAVSALVNLGYQPTRANGVISRALDQVGDTATTQDLIRLGLRELSQ